MGITQALTTALSGLAASQTEIDVVGNNIANVNTTGFKASTIDFKTQFLQNFSFGSAPNGNLGGSNPLQVGLGTTTGAMSTDFSDGSLQATGISTNVAIQGDGFFVLSQAGQQVYTRDGSFQLNDANQLVSTTGQLVQGYGVDSNFNIITGSLTNLTIPVGTAAVAQATKNATYSGSLNSDGSVPTSVANLTLTQPLFLSGGGSAPTSNTTLSSLVDANGTSLFNNGDTITLDATKGTPSITNPNGTSTTLGSGIRTLAAKTLSVNANTTLSDLQSFLQGSLGINTSNGSNGNLGPPSPNPGVTLQADANPLAVDLNIAGNPGYDNNINLNSNSISITSSGGVITNPFNWNKTSNADGESIESTQTVYDSLGSPIQLNVVATLISKSSAGTVWQYYADSPDGSATGANTQTAVGLGTVSFDANGQFLSTTSPTVVIDRSNTGALPTLNINIDFSKVTALGGNPSALISSQDGDKSGTLSKISIQSDGIIQGSFTNGMTRPVGQIVLATFQNDQGLISDGDNTYSSGPNSGAAVITTPGELATGALTAGSVEGSNVDLSTEFVKLIAASTAFSASSRVITSSDQLLQDLLSAVH